MKDNKTLPVYSKRKCSDDFYLAFSAAGTSSSITCICGRTHFSDEFPLEDHDDEATKKQLDKNAEDYPDEYICHSGTISHFSSQFASHDQSVVFDCKCNYAGFLENLIDDHSHSIIEYLKIIAAAKKKTADDFAESVSTLPQ